jgi:hypothetical protein
MHEHPLRWRSLVQSPTLLFQPSGSSTAGFSGFHSGSRGRHDLLNGVLVSQISVRCKVLQGVVVVAGVASISSTTLPALRSITGCKEQRGDLLLSVSLRVHRGVEVWKVEMEGRA